MGKEAGRPLTFLTASTTNESSSWLDVKTNRQIYVYIIATSVTSGATVAIESRDSAGNVVQLDSRAIAANGNTVVQVENTPIREVRATISARTDGTYTISGHAV